MRGLHGRSPCALYLLYCTGQLLLQAKAVCVYPDSYWSPVYIISPSSLSANTQLIFSDLNSRPSSYISSWAFFFFHSTPGTGTSGSQTTSDQSNFFEILLLKNCYYFLKCYSAAVTNERKKNKDPQSPLNRGSSSSQERMMRAQVFCFPVDGSPLGPVLAAAC